LCGDDRRDSRRSRSGFISGSATEAALRQAED
jgi:hypothetical protein